MQFTAAASDLFTILCLSTQAAYKKWKEETLAYYAVSPVNCVEPKELDHDERMVRRAEYLKSEYEAESKA